MVRDLPFERYVSDKDMLDFTLRQRYPPIFRISDMLSAKRKKSEELMGEKTKDSRWMIEDPKKRKASLGGWVAGKSGGDYDKMFGSNFNSNQAAYLDAYGQMAYDVLPDIHTDELRPMVREGWKPPTSMEYLTDLLVDGPFDDGWDKPRQYFPASNIPLKNLPPRLRTMMDGLKERNFGFAPQFILDNAEDEYGRVGTRNAEKEYRKQGGARDQFVRRSAIEAAILLNMLDRERKSANKEVVQNLVESGLYDEEYPSMRAFDPSWKYMQPEVLYGTEEDEPVIMNEAFSENWQLFNRSDDSPFDTAWALLKNDDFEDFFVGHENHPNTPVEDLDYNKPSEYYQGEYDSNVLNVPFIQEMLQDLQQFATSLCLDSLEERIILSEGLIGRGWTKSGNLARGVKQ